MEERNNIVDKERTRGILVDLDGPVYCMGGYYRTKLHKLAYHRNIAIGSPNYTTYGFKEMLGEELEKVFLSELYLDYLLHCPMVEGMDEVLSILFNHYKIHIVTSRGVWASMSPAESKRDKQITVDRLSRDCIAYDELVFTNDKIEYIKNNSIDFVIEDHPGTLSRAASETDAIGICMDDTYNKEWQGLRAYSSWHALQMIMEHKRHKELVAERAHERIVPGMPFKL